MVERQHDSREHFSVSITSDAVLGPGSTVTSDVATDPRDTIYENGLPVTLDAGTYTATRSCRGNADKARRGLSGLL